MTTRTQTAEARLAAGTATNAASHPRAESAPASPRMAWKQTTATTVSMARAVRLNAVLIGA